MKVMSNHPGSQRATPNKITLYAKGVFYESNKTIALALSCLLLAASVTNVIAADNDGWTQADKTDAAANGAWDEWVTQWETEKDNWENISLTPGKNETELNFAWYSKTSAGVPQFRFYEKGTEEAEVTVTQSPAVDGYNSNKVTVTGLVPGKTYCYTYTKDGVWDRR